MHHYIYQMKGIFKRVTNSQKISCEQIGEFRKQTENIFRNNNQSAKHRKLTPIYSKNEIAYDTTSKTIGSLKNNTYFRELMNLLTKVILLLFHTFFFLYRQSRIVILVVKLSPFVISMKFNYHYLPLAQRNQYML